MPAEPVPARGVRSDELEELAHAVRRELLRRGEAPGPGWVEDVVRELGAGRVPGFYHPSTEGHGLGFYSTRGDRAFGHVHVEPGAEAILRARQLLEKLQEGLPSAIHSFDVGFTGLSPAEERSLGTGLQGTPGATLLVREAMERRIVPADSEPVTPPPEEVRLRPLYSIPRAVLAELDFRAFEGTDDASLIGTERSEYRRMMDELLDGRLGRFLEEASTAVVREKSDELLGALMTSEQSPQMAVFLNVMVTPSFRRRGLGRFLVRWGFRALWALGYPKVRLWVTESNGAARGLYANTGFASVGTALIYRFSRQSR